MSCLSKTGKICQWQIHKTCPSNCARQSLGHKTQKVSSFTAVSINISTSNWKDVRKPSTLVPLIWCSEAGCETHKGQNFKRPSTVKILGNPGPTLPPSPVPHPSQELFRCNSAWIFTITLRSRVLLFLPFYRWETDLEWFTKSALWVTASEALSGFSLQVPVHPSLLHGVFSLLLVPNMPYQVLIQHCLIPCTHYYCFSLFMSVIEYTLFKDLPIPNHLHLDNSPFLRQGKLETFKSKFAEGESLGTQMAAIWYGKYHN